MKTLTIDPADSLMQRMRNMGLTVPDFPTTVPALVIQPGLHRAVGQRGEGPTKEPVFWVDSEGHLLVDGQLFSTLTTAFVPRMGAGESVSVGHWKKPGAMTPQDIAELLIRAGIILTYVHIGSELCITPDSTDGRIHMVGTHTYFTNEENQESIAFTVHFDADGRITVRTD
jgi:hypothetical protein